LTPNKEKNKSS